MRLFKNVENVKKETFWDPKAQISDITVSFPFHQKQIWKTNMNSKQIQSKNKVLQYIYVKYHISFYKIYISLQVIHLTCIIVTIVIVLIR